MLVNRNPLPGGLMKPHMIEFIEEWHKAAKRLRKTSPGRGRRAPAVLAWMIDFAQTPLAELSAGQRSDKAWEVTRCAFDGGLVFASDNLQPDSKILDFMIDHTEGEWPVSLESMTRIQATVKTALDHFLDDGRAELPRAEGSFVVSNSKTNEPGSLRFSGTTDATFYFIAGQLLAQHGGLLRRCAKCRKLVLVSRKDKGYCSQACQIAAWKGKNPKSKTTRKVREGGKRHGTKR